MAESREFIVRRLQEILAEEALKLSQETTMLKDDLASYIKQVTRVADWEDDFLAEVYELYLRKVTKTGEALCRHISEEPGE